MKSEPHFPCFCKKYEQLTCLIVCQDYFLHCDQNAVVVKTNKLYCLHAEILSLGHNSPHSHGPLIKNTHSEVEEKGDSGSVYFCSEESALGLLSSASCNREDNLKISTTSSQALEYASSEAESLEKEETSSLSTEEDDISDTESSENGLEPGEISPLVRKGVMVKTI